MFYPSGLFRLKARSVLKGHWQTALLIALIVNLPTLLMQGFSAFTGNDLASRLQSVLISSSRDGLIPQQLLLKEIDSIMGSTAFWTMRGLELLAWLITPCLTLGMYRWLMNRVRGLEDPVSTVLCRMNQFFRAIALQLLVILKILLWMLPGIALSVYLLLPVYQSGDINAQLAALQRSYHMPLPVTLLNFSLIRSGLFGRGTISVSTTALSPPTCVTMTAGLMMPRLARSTASRISSALPPDVAITWVLR